MLSRFAKSLIFVIFAMVSGIRLLVVSSINVPAYQFLLTMVAIVHPPSRTYIDPWTGELFGEGGLEGNLHSKLDPNLRIGGVKGGVIMSKLGNETAKYAGNHSSLSGHILFIQVKGSTWPCYVEIIVSFISFNEEICYNCKDIP